MKELFDLLLHSVPSRNAGLPAAIAGHLRRHFPIFRPVGGNGEDGIRFGGETLAPGEEKLHIALVGTTGSGKSTLMQLLQQQALPSVGRGMGRRALLYDAKGDLLSVVRAICPNTPLYLLNPFDRRTSNWDLSADIEDPSTAQQVAAIFIPDNDSLAQPFFEHTARDILGGLILSFTELTRRHGVRWDLRDLLVACSPRHARMVLEVCPQNADLIRTQLKGRPDTVKDIFATLATKIAPFRAIAALWSRAESSISLRDWSRDESILVIGSNAAKSEAINAINRVLFSRLVDLFTNQMDRRDHRDDPRRSWVFLDELPQLGRLPKLRELFAFGRSKGVCVVVGIQDIEGLYPIYGKDTVHSLLGNVSHKAILRLESDITAEWASALFGKKQILLRTHNASSSYGASGAGTSSGSGESFHELPEVMAGEFMGLPQANSSHGIGGYYLFPGAWKRHDFNPFSGSELLRPDPSTQNYDKADGVGEYLQDWDEEDLARLGLLDGAPVTSQLAVRKNSAHKEAANATTEGRLPRD